MYDSHFNQDQFISSLTTSLGSSAIQDWFGSVSITFDDKSAVLSVPTEFIRDWISTHYTRQIVDALKTQSIDAELVVRVTHTSHTPETKSTELSTRSLPLDDGMTFHNFVIGKSNEIAFTTAHRLAHASSILFNPLFIYGDVGVGKTHLLNAIAWTVKKAGKQACYISAEQFMVHFVEALRHRDIMSFKNDFRSVDILVIDDFQFMSGKDSTQEEFFHTFVSLISNKKQLIVSADRPPSALSSIVDRLKSRLGGGLVVNVHPPTYELRFSIVEKKLAAFDASLSRDVVAFLATHVTSSVRELEGAVRRLINHQQIFSVPMDVTLAKTILADIFTKSDRTVNVTDVISVVAEYYKIEIDALCSTNRKRILTQARQVAMYVARNLTSTSLSELGKKFSGRDHTTALYAIKQVEQRLETDVVLAQDIENIKSRLR